MGGTVSSLDEAQQRLVIGQLEQIEASAHFHSSRRCREFLRFVVTESLEGRADDLKERSIAAAVFGRDSAYDPTEHSLVRVKAVEVRKRLAKYYASAEAAPVRIELSPGTYVPKFVIHPEPLPVQRGGKRRKWMMIAGGGVLVTSVVIALLWPAPDPLHQLWKPFLTSSLPVLIGVPSPKIYEYVSSTALPPEGQIPVTDLRLREDYTGRGAAVGAARIAALLSAEKCAFEVKFGSDLSFADLKRQPAALLGGFSSTLTVELTKRLPVRLVRGPGWDGFEDAAEPSRRWIRSSFHHSADLKEDYAMVARLLDSGSGQNVMLVAGLAAPGTQAAVESITTRTYFEQLLGKLPPDWERKNFLAVLHADIHQGNPGPPRVVHTRVW